MLNKEPVQNRSCGSCNACCTVLQITELDKPLNTPCKHLCQSDAGSCGIYTERPPSCSNFQCLYLQGWIGGEIHRPDKCGIMWTVSKGDVYQAWLLTETIDTKQQYMLNKVAKSIVFVIRRLNGKSSLMGPKGAVKRFLEKRGLTSELYRDGLS